MNRQENVIKTISEIFQQREYTDIDTSDPVRIFANKKNGERVCAFTTIISKLNIEEIKSHIVIMGDDEIKHGLFVFEGVPTPAVKKVVENIPDLDMVLELFTADDLQFNITKHILVPQHCLLDKQQTLEFKEKYGVAIPVMLKNDPIARFYNFSKGDIVKVIRRNGFISYRIVR